MRARGAGRVAALGAVQGDGSWGLPHIPAASGNRSFQHAFACVLPSHGSVGRLLQVKKTQCQTPTSFTSSEQKPELA